jgi:hypothetical protein
VAVKMAVAMRLVTFMMNSSLVVVLVVLCESGGAVSSAYSCLTTSADYLPNSAFAAERH